MSHLPNSTFDPNSICMFPFKSALFLEKIAQRIEIIRVVTKKKEKIYLFERKRAIAVICFARFSFYSDKFSYARRNYFVQLFFPPFDRNQLLVESSPLFPPKKAIRPCFVRYNETWKTSCSAWINLSLTRSRTTRITRLQPPGINTVRSPVIAIETDVCFCSAGSTK